MKGGLGNIMKQAQKMQENLQKAQAEIAAMEITGESGGGLVSVTITGRYEVKRLRIDDSLVGTTRTCWRIWWRPHSTMPSTRSSGPCRRKCPA